MWGEMLEIVIKLLNVHGKLELNVLGGCSKKKG